jgi:hypothetical protein
MPVALPPPGEYPIAGAALGTVKADNTIQLGVAGDPGPVRLEFGPRIR